MSKHPTETAQPQKKVWTAPSIQIVQIKSAMNGGGSSLSDKYGSLSGTD